CGAGCATAPRPMSKRTAVIRRTPCRARLDVIARTRPGFAAGNSLSMIACVGVAESTTVGTPVHGTLRQRKVIGHAAICSGGNGRRLVDPAQTESNRATAH